MGGLVSSLGPPSEVWESGLKVLCSMLAAPTHMYVNYIHCMYPPSLCNGVTVLATAKNLKCKVEFQNSHCIITARHLKQLPHPNEKLRFSRAPGLSLNHEALLQHISSFFFPPLSCIRIHWGLMLCTAAWVDFTERALCPWLAPPSIITKL